MAVRRLAYDVQLCASVLKTTKTVETDLTPALLLVSRTIFQRINEINSQVVTGANGFTVRNGVYRKHFRRTMGQSLVS